LGSALDYLSELAQYRCTSYDWREHEARLNELPQFVTSSASMSTLPRWDSCRSHRSTLTDSPVGQLAWIVEKFQDWTHGSEVPEGAVDRDRMLTNMMPYGLTAPPALRPTSTTKASTQPQPSGVPAGVALFAEDIAIRRYAAQSNKIVHWSEFDRGGHFAAMETPDLLIADVRDFFRPLR
jgi:pimeloyl-ACP methyl ester carboxylesterase